MVRSPVRGMLLLVMAVGCGGGDGANIDAAGLIDATGADGGSAGPGVDLADIVGGGDGSGNGGDQGIDMLTGAVATAHASVFDCPPNVLRAAANPLVDGVFCPDGGAAEDAAITVSTTGVTITGVPDWVSIVFTQQTFDHIWNGTNMNVETTSTGPLIGAHANKGITFDLDAIEAAHGGAQATRFTADAAIGTRTPLAENVMSFLVYVDGALRFEERMVTTPSSRFPISIELAPGDRFLTLVTAATGDIQSDWSFWDAPRLSLE